MKKVINNPILSGFHPDPSICRVGEDFYLVNSTFEYFPGIPVYHSKDLINWEQIGHCLTRNSQVSLKKGAPNCIGIYAPTIRYNNGVFYCIVTNVGDEHYSGNFYVWTKDPYGEWSEPVYTDFEGIDPSLFFDDDGGTYYSGTDDDGVYVCKMDIVTGKRLGDKMHLWSGSGANNPEGPHVYKINGYYYIMMAEGGTEIGHMETIARSKELNGPYEECPHNPILTNRGIVNSIMAVGHADLVDDIYGNWWAVCLCNRPTSYPFTHCLGRETLLLPVKWENGWPVVGVNGHAEPCIEVEVAGDESSWVPTGYIPCSQMRDEFDGSTLHPSWNYIYNTVDGLVEKLDKGVILHGNDNGIDSDDNKALICRRQEHFDCEATVAISSLVEVNGAETGISAYLNNRHHYEIVLANVNGKKGILFRRQLGTMVMEENFTEYNSSEVELKLICSKTSYKFAYKKADGRYEIVGEGETRLLSTEAGGCFTGNVIALYSTRTDATISSFEYKITQ